MGGDRGRAKSRCETAGDDFGWGRGGERQPARGCRARHTGRWRSGGSLRVYCGQLGRPGAGRARAAWQCWSHAPLSRPASHPPCAPAAARRGAGASVFGRQRVAPSASAGSGACSSSPNVRADTLAPPGLAAGTRADRAGWPAAPVAEAG
eukprot:scaffold17701_cov113-Isochrysis_galbana.AAC.7